MLRSIRDRSGSILVKLLLGLLILSFGVWGMGDVFFGQADIQRAAYVGDTEVPIHEVQSELNREMARLRQILGDVDPQRARELGLVDSILDRLVNRVLLELAANDLGILVGDDLLREKIRVNPSFFGGLGRFDRVVFEQTLQSNSLTEDRYVNILKGDVKRTMLVDSLTGQVAPPKALVDAVYRFRHEKRVVETLLLRANDMPAPEDPGDDVLRAYHKDNPASFTAPEYRKIVAVVLTTDEIAAETAVSEEEIAAAYEGRKAEFGNPERRAVRQMVLLDDTAAQKAHEALKSGREFEEVAKEFADADADTLTLGVLARDEMLPELSEAAFSQSKDDFSAPVQSPLGWHILQVTEIHEGYQQSLEQVHDALRNLVAKEKAIDGLYELSNRLDDAVGGGASLEEAAGRLNLNLIRIDSLDAAGRDAESQAIENLPPYREFLDTAFKTSEGEESLLEEAGSDAYFIIRVDGVTPPALKPFDTVREQVLGNWRAGERRNAAQAKATAVKERLQASADPATVAAELKLAWETSTPFSRDGRGVPGDLSRPVVETAFHMEPGQFDVAGGQSGTFLVRLKEVQAADPRGDKSGLKRTREQLQSNMRADLQTQLGQALRQDHPVTVNREALNEVF